jgi:hypothetical protein
VPRYHAGALLLMVMLALLMTDESRGAVRRDAPRPCGAGVAQDAARPVPLSDAARALLTELGFDQSAVADVAAGKPVAVIVHDSGDESAQAGAVWINATQGTFVERFSDIEAFEASDAVKAIKKMATPPVAADLSALDFPQADVGDLRNCRVGSCAVKIGRPGLQRVQQQVDWSTTDALASARQVLREVLFGYVQSYQQQGAAGLPTFTDKDNPTSVKKELDAILTDSPYLAAQAPALAAYVKGYPAGAPGGLTEFFYWQLADIGLKPIVTIDHAMVLPAADNNGVTAVAAVQLYASHYFYAALQLYFLMPPSRGSDGFLMVAVNRSRSDGLTGFTGMFVRGKAERRGRKSLQGFLGVAKQRVEGDGSGS